jgi:hypothetical protein
MFQYNFELKNDTNRKSFLDVDFALSLGLVSTLSRFYFATIIFDFLSVLYYICGMYRYFYRQFTIFSLSLFEFEKENVECFFFFLIIALRFFFFPFTVSRHRRRRRLVFFNEASHRLYFVYRQ